MNAPERFLTWRYEYDSEAVNKLKYEADTKMPNAGNSSILILLSID